MNIQKILFLLLLFSCLQSCVSTKDLEYLQDKNQVSNEVVTPYNIKPYRLQSHDIISISVRALDPKLVAIFNTDNSEQNTASEQSLYMKGYTVDDHGNIRMPILGEVNVLGYTTEEVRTKVEELLLKDHFKNSAGLFVTVKLGGFRYTVNGEVGNPGTKVLYQDKVSVLEAIANSGDITMVGNRKEVKIIRQFPSKVETFSIDLTNSNAIHSPVFYLQPNDYIYVKPLKQKSWGTGKTGIESLGTIITILSLATTTFLLLK
ncbi:polysaccharide biosynthesis/export family protein [Flavobacterium croceum]|uniref:polysaccharide biosynthesis/export family protein n=1 Tax=Flavobacterium croceum TaxID=370975 RepID=UPI0024A911EA|nr:polysaccharide biosynthesis/export family protein [Flavobacterium croceum]